MSRPEPDFVLADLWTELLGVDSGLDGALTSSELAEATGLSRNTIIKRITPAVKDGRREVTRKQIVDLTGRAMHVPAYRITAGRERDG